MFPMVEDTAKHHRSQPAQADGCVFDLTAKSNLLPLSTASTQQQPLRTNLAARSHTPTKIEIRLPTFIEIV